MTTPRKSGRGRQGRRARPRKGREPASVTATEVPAAAEPPAEEPGETPVVAVEALFAARVPPPRPPAPPPSRRCAVFFDVENTSRAEHIARVLAHLELDWMQNATELVGVGNWRGNIPTTTVYYSPGELAAARRLAYDLGVSRIRPAVPGMLSNHLTVVLHGDP